MGHRPECYSDCVSLSLSLVLKPPENAGVAYGTGTGLFRLLCCLSTPLQPSSIRNDGPHTFDRVQRSPSAAHDRVNLDEPGWSDATFASAVSAAYPAGRSNCCSDNLMRHLGLMGAFPLSALDYVRYAGPGGRTAKCRPVDRPVVSETLATH